MADAPMAFELLDQAAEGALGRLVRHGLLGVAQGGEIRRLGELEQGLLAFETHGFFLDRDAQGAGDGTEITADRSLDEGVTRGDVGLGVGDAGDKRVSDARTGDLDERFLDAIRERGILRERGEHRDGLRTADLGQGERGRHAERRIRLGGERGDLRRGASSLGLGERGEEKFGDLDVRRAEQGGDLAGQRRVRLIDQALTDIVHRSESDGDRRVGLLQRVDGLRGALTEILQRGRISGVIDRRTIRGDRQRGGEKESEEGAHVL